MLGIVWYKHDLRIEDHLPLHSALQECDQIIAVYNHHPIHEQPFLGIDRSSRKRKYFLQQSLVELQELWRIKGSRLLIGRGEDTTVFQEIRKQVRQEFIIYTSKESGSEELKRVERLKASFEVRSFETHLLYPVSDLPFSLEDLPQTFTPYRKKVEAADLEIRTIQEPEHIPGVEISWQDAGFKMDQEALILSPGIESAQERLRYYLEGSHLIANYKQTRNGMLGLDFSSHMSVYLSHGSLSPRIVYTEVKAYEKRFGSNESTYWLIFELLWRDYFRLVHYRFGHRFFYRSGIKAETKNWSSDREKLESWKQGKTGDDLVDACMIELKETGLMSNRGRQNAASYLIHDLGIDWRWGAAWFEHHLLDYDVSSNWGNWMYIAGVGNDPRPVRKFNTRKQAEQYDGDRRFRDFWLSEKKSP